MARMSLTRRPRVRPCHESLRIVAYQEPRPSVASAPNKPATLPACRERCELTLDQGPIVNGVLGVLPATFRVEGTQPTVMKASRMVVAMADVPEDVQRWTAKGWVALVMNIVTRRRRRPKLPGESTG
jgi:hypothetical protein